MSPESVGWLRQIRSGQRSPRLRFRLYSAEVAGSGGVVREGGGGLAVTVDVLDTVVTAPAEASVVLQLGDRPGGSDLARVDDLLR